MFWNKKVTFQKKIVKRYSKIEKGKFKFFTQKAGLKN